MSKTAAAKIRVLCLHGYGQNAEFFRARTGALRKGLPKGGTEYEFIDGPYEAKASFLSTEDADGQSRGKMLGWWDFEGDASRPSASARYIGLQESLQRVRQKIEDDGPFDGIFGFSQGATLAAMLCLVQPKPPPVRWIVLCAAFLPRVTIGPCKVSFVCADTFLHATGIGVA